MAWRQGGFKPEGGVRNVCPGVINRIHKAARPPTSPDTRPITTSISVVMSLSFHSVLPSSSINPHEPCPSLCTEVRGIGILRTSPFGHSRKLDFHFTEFYEVRDDKPHSSNSKNHAFE